MKDYDPESFSERGSWWLPGETSEKRRGLLKYSANGGAVLEIDGTLLPVVGRQLPIVHGKVRGNKAVTLFAGNVVRISKHGLGGADSPEHSSTDAHFLRGVIGGHFNSENDLRGLRLSLTNSLLTDWVGAGSVKQNRNGTGESIYTQKIADSILLHESSEWKVYLGMQIHSTTEAHRLELIDEWVLEIASTQERSIEEFTVIESAFLALFTLSTGMTLPFTQRVFHAEQPPIKGSNFKRWSNLQLVRSTSQHVQRKQSIRPGHEVISYSEAAERKLLTRLLEAPKTLLPSILHHRSLVILDDIPAELQFIGWALNLESLHKLVVGTEEKTYRERILKLIAYAGSNLELYLGEPSKFSEDMRRWRNRFAHEVIVAISENSSQEYEELFNLELRAALLSEAVLLRALDFHEEEIQRKLRNSFPLAILRGC